MRHNIHVKLKMQCIQHIFIYPDCKWVTSLLLPSSKLRSFFQLAFFVFGTHTHTHQETKNHNKFVSLLVEFCVLLES